MSVSAQFNNFIGKAKRLEDGDIPWIGAAIGVGEDELRAFIDVESRGQGFDAQNRPTILFEPHLFWRNLPGHKRDRAAKENLAAPRWGMIRYGKYSEQYRRLEAAIEIDVEAGLKSASWGLCQVIGSNHRMVGYDTVEEFVKAIMDDEESHLKACVEFLKSSGIDDDLRARRWEVVARVYNGPAYKRNGYDIKLKRRYEYWRSQPDSVKSSGVEIRNPINIVEQGLDAERRANSNPVLLSTFSNDEVKQIQIRLRALKYFEVGKADGLWGTRTIGAIAAFQANEGLPITVNKTPMLDPETRQRLTTAQEREVNYKRQTSRAHDIRSQGSIAIARADQINLAQWGQIVLAVLECVVLAYKSFPDQNIGIYGGLLTMFGSPIWLVPLVQFAIALYTRLKSNSVIVARVNAERSGLHNGEPGPSRTPPNEFPPTINQGLGIERRSPSVFGLLLGPR
ncbi:N-acetylmuramidase domain-containing protein [Methylobacterium sp. Leaf118]|uniref:N-acetylmuramidase domain-containing protein n=1 Tax=Methylobacterium sp. Leaf118 TaxID=2876562 RepID=UPI001E4EC6EB|nr:N-acetylmuramidase domain-containing protein [Methylobacterium sp. Leaf118]